MIPRITAYEDSPPLRGNIVTVAMPGITSTRSQISRYTGPEGVTVLRNWNDLKLNKENDTASPKYDVEKSVNRHRTRSVWHICRNALRVFWTGEAEDCAADVTVVVADEEGSAACVMSSANGGGDVAVEEDIISDDGGDGSAIDPPFLYRATCRVAPRLLHNVLPSPEVPETVYRRFFLTANPMHWALTLKEIMTSLWFHVRPVRPRYCEVGLTNLAGHADQRVMHREVRRAVRHIEADEAKGQPPRHVVMFGCSRGAATCFYTAMKLPQELAARVSLVVVEAPFDTLEHVIAASSWFPKLNLRFFKAFCDYRGRVDEATAYDFDPEKVHIRCPVAFVLSMRDNRVPNVCTQVLIERVQRELVPHKVPAVEVLVLKHSRHPCMPVGHKEDQDAYVTFMEHLYDKYCK